MKLPQLVVFLSFSAIFTLHIEAQKRRVPAKIYKPPVTLQRTAGTGNPAVIIDETLAVLRVKPSLFSDSIQRMRRGRRIQILDTREADGVMFYKISAPPNNFGWVQSEAVFGKFRRGDDERLAKLIQASEGFDQIEIGMQFFKVFPDSKLKPAILLLLGDLIEEAALKLSRDATRRLVRKEMAASGAPLHSFYLNFVSLDRYRKLGIVFLFNSDTKNYHYDGAFWQELAAKHPNTPEAAEARKRLDSLKEKLERKL